LKGIGVATRGTDGWEWRYAAPGEREGGGG